MMQMESVWKRTAAESEGSIVSDRVYNLVIGLTLLWGFGVNYLMVKSIPFETVAGINPIVFFVGYLASCFFGVYLYRKSSNPLVSFIGYNFVVVPFGLIINRVVNYFLTKQGLPFIDYFSFPWSLCLGAIGFAVLISLIAGIYPAVRAARVDPVDSLREE